MVITLGKCSLPLFGQLNLALHRIEFFPTLIQCSQHLVIEPAYMLSVMRKYDVPFSSAVRFSKN